MSVNGRTGWMGAGRDMAYRKVRVGHGGALQGQDLEELQPTVELEWDMEKELEEPGMDRFQLEDGEQRSGNPPVSVAVDLDPPEPSTSPGARAAAGGPGLRLPLHPPPPEG
ncbi:hypothetical protein COCON_G00058870, partial [Conger conger]